MPVIFENGIEDYGVIDHPQQLWDGGAASGIYKFNTPDGGIQDGYFLEQKVPLKVEIKVGF